ncbi:4-vinyl reductase [Chroococcidiopsis sp. CCALA 051]|nr:MULTISPECIES: V4R domain-containing protein [unclassified Chroococcidiopsis]MBE9017398.1 4-vinyl reductase [Chroococcidiopsidales cyanobacterium LEGE 13417]PSM49496.1 4-vinyl reductase [Chroococcidiopsis sp. CCALA 051]URD50754.1 4-vinyl reductase [Chroococcidiopsis sp. CCNUC1]
MITVADLIKDERLPGNYFAFDAYIQGDFESGLLENRHGDRLIAIPDTLIQSIYTALNQETGQASGVVLANCGRWWGKNFYARFIEQVSEYYSKPINEMEMVEFTQCLRQCWKAHGWGTFELDLSYYQQGFLVVKTQNSPYAKQAPQSKRPVCHFEAGILRAFFSQLTGRELHCLQTTCESLGAEYNHFVLGLAQRIKPADAWLEEQQEHEIIMHRLCNSSNQ